MTKTGLIGIIVAALIVIGGAIALGHKSNNPNSANNTVSNQSSQSNAPASGTINIVNMLFTPSQITVRQGGTVTWTNNDKTTHTVEDDLANVDGPHSGDIAPGQSYSFRFEKTGSFQYHCRIHPSMRGTIVVKA
ncbi:MAG TPA: cupredoxin domain-containing protein [Candidatus Saccharimonadales bacterium]|nr:cupredoxin domain-containing protein [Candidatus Saccharimonadales bacterium]